MKPHRGKRTDRAGYALVLFLMMVFGLMGLAALVIDLGFARLAQRQMQTAVDSAALEGLRLARFLATGIRPVIQLDGLRGMSAKYLQHQISRRWTNKARRWVASQMAANTFDDDLDPTNGDTGQYGAGPVVDFTGGVGPTELAASQTCRPAPAGLQTKACGRHTWAGTEFRRRAERRHEFGHVWLQPELRCGPLGGRGRKL